MGQDSTSTAMGAAGNAPAALSDICENLVAASVQAAVAAIEIYNKPVFSYREQAFTILIVNAWESLCKARLVADAQGDVQVLYVPKPDGSFKTGRSGNFLTIELTGAMKRLSLAPTVCGNLSSLIEIRDTATHLYTEPALQQLYSRALLVGHDARRKCRKTGHSWWRQCPFTYARMYSPQPGHSGATELSPSVNLLVRQ